MNSSDTLMEPILLILIPLALLLGGLFLAAFLRSAMQGQWDDLETPAKRLVEPTLEEKKQ